MWVIRHKDGKYYSRDNTWDDKIFLVYNINLAKKFDTKWAAEHKLKKLIKNYNINGLVVVERGNV